MNRPAQGMPPSARQQGTGAAFAAKAVPGAHQPCEPATAWRTARSPANDVDDAVTERLVALVELPSVVTRLATRVERLEQQVQILQRGDPDQLLDTAQAAHLLGMSEAAVRQAARRGTLPAEYRGRRLRFRRGVLLAATQTRRRAHAPASPDPDA